MKISCIVQRYGTDVVGGAERLCRGVAEGLAARRHEIEVLTTCARSYRTWANHYGEGVETINGVRVRRFRSRRERDVESFNALSEELFSGPRGPAAEEAWVQAQGPDVPALVDHLHAAGRDSDLLLFFTYLYYPTVHGIHAAPERSVLVPTAHDEAPFWLETYRSVFTLPIALAFNTEAERALVRRRFPEARQPSEVIGVGIEDLELLEAEAARADAAARARDDDGVPTLLYAGRIDEGKGVGTLIAWLQRFRAATGSPLRLLLMGEAAMDLPEQGWIEPLGFVSDELKRRTLAQADVLLAPSALESFGIVLLEAAAAGTPVLANGASDAYVEHCREGGGGLWYEGYEEFEEALKLLLGDASLRSALARAGAGYARSRFSWEAIAERYERFLGTLR